MTTTFICSPTLEELPEVPAGRVGWPWTEETPQLPDKRPDGSSWPGISIVTPSYNQGHFIEETIRAILLQGYPKLQYIISEDCSSDHTLEVIEKYEPWLTLLNCDQNRGMAGAINRAWQLCKGDIITWISADDVYLPGAFCAVASRWSAECEYGLAVGGFQFTDENSKIDPTVIPPSLPHSGPIDLTITADWRLHQVSTFYMRPALDVVGRFVREELRHNPDREILYRVSQRYKVLLIIKPLAAFRLHDDSKSGSVTNAIGMAKEYASIYEYFMTDNTLENSFRKKRARTHVAKGYLKYAKRVASRRAAIGALLRAVRYQPQMIWSRGYWLGWAMGLGIYAPLRALVRRDR